MRKLFERGFEVGHGKVRPGFAYKQKFRERAFPQQKIGETLLPAGANQQIHLRGAAPIDFREDAAERFRRKLGDFVEAAGSVKDGVAGGVVNREAKMQPGSASGGGFGIGDGLAQRGGHAMAAADDAETHALFDAGGGYGQLAFAK